MTAPAASPAVPPAVPAAAAGSAPGSASGPAPAGAAPGARGQRRGPTVFGNAGWLISDRFIRLLVSVVTSALLARTLGPSDFGLLQFGLSAVLLANETTTLGLRGVLVRRLALEPQASGGSLSAALLLRICASIIAGWLVVALGFTRSSADPRTLRLVLALFAIALLMRSGEVLFTWFEAQGKLRANSLTDSITGVTATGLRLLCVLTLHHPLAWVAACYVVEWAAVGAVPLVMLRRWPAAPARLDPLPTLARARQLLAESWPVAFATVATAVYLKIGQILLALLRSPADVGHFAAAAQVVEAASFIPLAVATAGFPPMLRLHGRDPAGYLRLFRRLTVLVTSLGWAFGLCLAVASPLVVAVMYGKAYAASVSLLAVQALAAPFLFQRAVLTRHLIADGLLRHSMLAQGGGAVVALVVDLALIPVLGAMGAVLGYLAAAMAASVGLLLVTRRTAGLGVLMATTLAEALWPPTVLAAARAMRGQAVGSALDAGGDPAQRPDGNERGHASPPAVAEVVAEQLTTWASDEGARDAERVTARSADRRTGPPAERPAAGDQTADGPSGGDKS